MLTPEPLAALERLRRVEDGEPIDSVYPNLGYGLGSLRDREILSRLALAEHPADDDTAVDEAWLRSVGFRDWPRLDDDSDLEGYDIYILANEEIGWECRLAYRANGFYLVRMCDPDVCDLLAAESVELFDSRNNRKVVTRGDVRRLCRALGIELKETTND